MTFRLGLFIALVCGSAVPGVIGLILLGLPGLFLYDVVIGWLGWPSIKDVIRDTSPPGATYWGVGLVLSLLWPFGVPLGYALASCIPMPRPWLRWVLGFVILLFWCVISVVVVHHRTLKNYAP